MYTEINIWSIFFRGALIQNFYAPNHNFAYGARRALCKLRCGTCASCDPSWRIGWSCGYDVVDNMMDGSGYLDIWGWQVFPDLACLLLATSRAWQHICVVLPQWQHVMLRVAAVWLQWGCCYTATRGPFETQWGSTNPWSFLNDILVLW